MTASTCCSADYEFACCTTTLLPEQKLEKACNDAAALCPCKWARCIKTDGFKASLCCKEGYQYKCCVDPDQSFKLIKKDTTELILELRAKTECKTANFTCFCDVSEYEGWRGVKFACCDSNFTCKCCDRDKPLHQTTPDLVIYRYSVEQCTKTCNMAQLLCEEFNGTASGTSSKVDTLIDDKCPKSPKQWHLSLVYMDHDWFKGCNTPTDRMVATRLYGCYNWFWPKPVHVEVKKECQGAIGNCACGWGACVWQPGFSASGCCKEDYSFECCTKVKAFDLIN
uniref:SMB domain-containing protein n=1 Tax=Globodera pallida TaxID=36090 RepID=A0A183CH22_GLOPA